MPTTEKIERGLRADALATRERIVAAAERLFAERGLDGVSLVEVGRAAGQRNRSAVQYHFGDKQGLVHAILDKHTPGIEARRKRNGEVTQPVQSQAGRKNHRAAVLNGRPWWQRTQFRSFGFWRHS